jgi:hypothetical protein
VRVFNDGYYRLAALLLGVAVAFVAGVTGYWLGHRHGSASRPEARSESASPSVHIPAYRVKELTILMELGVLTPEEFEHEKGKLHAGRSA